MKNTLVITAILSSGLVAAITFGQAGDATIPTPYEAQGVALRNDGKAHRVEAGTTNLFPVFWNEVMGSRRSRTLVICASKIDPKTMSTLDEDLGIMSRILEKAAKQRSDDDLDSAMGMQLRLLSSGSQAPIQNMYLEGYGALFFLNVGFPLLPPLEQTESEAPKVKTSSTWEEARQELYGSKEPIQFKIITEGTRAAYDARKVESLKESLLQALQNATHIRDLKPDEYIAVTVLGAGNASLRSGVQMLRPDGSPRGSPHNPKFSINAYAVITKEIDAGATGALGKNLMTLRARKADVDAFGSGDLNLEQFKQKVSIAVY